MKKGLLVFMFSGLISLTSVLYSQIGVNTTNPQAEIDINGDLQIRKEIRVGNSSDLEISAGKAGQVLTSQGIGLAPKWTDLTVSGGIKGEYLLKNTYFEDDRVGLNLNSAYTSPITSTAMLDASWMVIPGLSLQIATSKAKNRILITLQTVAQSDYNGGVTAASEWVDLTCGIFIDDELASLRYGRVKDLHYPQISFTILYAFDDLPVGNHDLKVAFQRRASSTSFAAIPLHVGQGAIATPAVSNAFMNKSIIRVDVFEAVDD